METKKVIDELEIEAVDDVMVVSFHKASILGSSVEAISGQLRELVGSTKQPRILIDFSSVRFFSSQMLGMLVDLWRRTKESEGLLAICGINPQLTRVFRVTHLDKLFDFYQDKATAVSVICSK